MQPTFIPWAGYFNLIHRSDNFIFLDDVQLEKQSWQTRNRIILSRSSQWISLPILHTSLQQKMNETKILISDKWKRKVIESFNQSYGKHKYFAEAGEIIDIIFSNNDLILSRFNQNIVEFVSGKISLNTKFHKASDLNINGVRSQRICSLCERFHAHTYLSPLGAQEYLTQDEFTKICKINLVFNNFNEIEYTQKNSDTFVPKLSIVDVVANIGWVGAMEYIKKDVDFK
jgi:hypothetical protein